MSCFLLLLLLLFVFNGDFERESSPQWMQDGLLGQNREAAYGDHMVVRLSRLGAYKEELGKKKWT